MTAPDAPNGSRMTEIVSRLRDGIEAQSCQMCKDDSATYVRCGRGDCSWERLLMEEAADIIEDACTPSEKRMPPDATFSGTFDHVRVESFAMTQQEVVDAAHQPQGATPRTVTWRGMDDALKAYRELEQELATLRAPLPDVESQVRAWVHHAVDEVDGPDWVSFTKQWDSDTSLVPADYARKQAAMLREALETIAEHFSSAPGPEFIAMTKRAELAEQQRDGEMMAHQVTIQQRAPQSTPPASSPPEEKTPRDTARLDWLERMVVNVRQAAVHGSLNLFWASPTDVEGADDEPSDIRAQIDYQQRGGDRPPMNRVDHK